jgi:hypothetical protein
MLTDGRPPRLGEVKCTSGIGDVARLGATVKLYFLYVPGGEA